MQLKVGRFLMSVFCSIQWQNTLITHKYHICRKGIICLFKYLINNGCYMVPYLVHFRSIPTIVHFYNNKLYKCIQLCKSMWCRDLNSQLFDHDSPFKIPSQLFVFPLNGSVKITFSQVRLGSVNFVCSIFQLRNIPPSTLGNIS